MNADIEKSEDGANPSAFIIKAAVEGDTTAFGSRFVSVTNSG